MVYIDKKVATKHFQTSIFILTQHVCFKFLGCWMYLVARMELLARFLLHRAAPCFLLLGFSPWINRAKGSSCIWSVLYKCNLIPSHWREQAQFFPHYLTTFVSYTWDPEFTSSTLTIFWGSWASFIVVHKICLVRFYLPQEEHPGDQESGHGTPMNKKKRTPFFKQSSSSS